MILKNIVSLFGNWDTLLCDIGCGQPAKGGHSIFPPGRRAVGRAEDQTVLPSLRQKQPVTQHQNCQGSKTETKEEQEGEDNRVPGQGSRKSTCFELVIWSHVPVRCLAGPLDTFSQREMMVPTIQGPSNELTKYREHGEQHSTRLGSSRLPTPALPRPARPGATEGQGLFVHAISRSTDDHKMPLQFPKLYEFPRRKVTELLNCFKTAFDSNGRSRLAAS